MSSLTRGLARLIRTLPVTAADLGDAERYVRDWVGCSVAGRATEPGRALLAYGGGHADLEGRVFLAAALSHVTETDDLHRGSTTHPGCVVVPTALLLGRELGADGPAALAAVLAGFEAMLRVGEALGPAHYRVFHNTATAGVFGSAAAAASLLGLDEERWVWALGNAGTQAAGLWQFNEDATMSKHLHAGHAAAAGLRAALLAREGFTGPARILEGERGFFRGLCPDAVPDAVLRPAAGWKLAETSIKPYPSCRHTHPAIDAALELRARVSAPQLREAGIVIGSYPAALALTDNPAPTTPYAAKFSLQFCVATALLHGVPGPAAFTPEALRDPATRALAGRATAHADPTLSAAYPGRWGATVALSLPGGGAEVALREDALGDPEQPLSDAALDAKVAELLDHGGLDRDAAAGLLADVRAMTAGGAVPALPDLRREGGSAAVSSPAPASPSSP